VLALGLVFSGLFSDRLAHRWSRRVVFWGGALGLAASLVLLSMSHQFASLLLAALGMGFGSSLTQVMIQALLSDQHGERRSIAFTEANVAASFSTTLTPIVIGVMQRADIDWRFVSILAILFLTSLAVPFYRDHIPDSNSIPSHNDVGRARLSISFWLSWLALVLIVSVEMTLAIWATDFLANSVGFGRANAALAFGAFPAAMLIGRFIGSRLTRRWSSLSFLLLTFAIVAVGFPLFWLSRLPLLNVLGLFITGLGIANQYPLTLSIAVGLAADQANAASARASLGVGIALLSAPLLLGALADRFNLRQAYGIVILLLGAALIVVLMNNRLLQRQNIFLTAQEEI
jgi:MFS family permease